MTHPSPETPGAPDSAAEAEMAEVWDAIGLLTVDDAPVAIKPPLMADRRLWLAAACLVIGVAGAGLWMQRPQIYRTPVGGHLTLTLADGSRVSLNTASAIEVRLNGERRDVRLTAGEAYFEVAHLADKAPFFVTAGETRIRVTGTRFAVDLHPDRRVDIDLLEGHIRAAPSRDSQVDGADAISLSAGEGLRMDASGHVAARVPAAAQYVTGWLQHRAYFDETPLAEAVTEMNRYRTDPLVIADPAKAGARITGVFDTSDSDGFAKAVQAVYGVRLRSTGQTDNRDR
jgi:transmembrane sensor